MLHKKYNGGRNMFVGVYTGLNNTTEHLGMVKSYTEPNSSTAYELRSKLANGPVAGGVHWRGAFLTRDHLLPCLLHHKSIHHSIVMVQVSAELVRDLCPGRQERDLHRCMLSPTRSRDRKHRHLLSY